MHELKVDRYERKHLYGFHLNSQERSFYNALLMFIMFRAQQKEAHERNFTSFPKSIYDIHPFKGCSLHTKNVCSEVNKVNKL